MAQAKAAANTEVIEPQWEEIQPFTQPITMEPGAEFTALYLGGTEITVAAIEGDEGAIVGEDGKVTRTAMLHEFQDESATEPFGVWGSAVLDKRLAEVPPNSRVKVRYEGKTELEGGRTARQYRVWQDKSAKF